MNLDRDAPPRLIDANAFSSALGAGDVDACLELLRTDENGGPDTAVLNCRLAEVLFHDGRGEEALECGRRAFALAPAHRDTSHFCAWLFSNCSVHDEAAAAYERLLGLSPDWAEGHRHLSGSLAAIGDFDRATAHAMRALELMPDDNDTAIHAAELLLHCGHVEEAAGLVRLAAHRDPHDDRVLRVLSAIEMLVERFDAALAAIDEALRVAPDNPEYHLHRGHLLYRCGDTEGAAGAFATAVALDPENAAAKRAQIALFLDNGRVIEATALGGALLHSHPDDKAAAEAVLHLLNRRLETIDGDYVVVAARTIGPERPLRPSPGFGERLRTQGRVIQALIIRESRTRFGEAKLGYGWALLEPILHITMLSGDALVCHCGFGQLVRCRCSCPERGIDPLGDLALGKVRHAARERLADRQAFGISLGIEHPQHRVNVNQIGA